MDPITISTVASLLMKAGPSVLRSIGSLFGGDTAKTANSVAGIVETVGNAVSPQDQQRVLEQKLAQLSPEQLVQLESLKVQLQQFQLERDKAVLADRQAAHHEQQETVRNGDNSVDEYVRRTRPLMARLSLYSSILYVLLLAIGQQGASISTAAGHAMVMPEPDWDIALMLAMPALTYLGFRTLDGFARYSKSSKHKLPVGN
ncbi:holin family protein [Serratia liquefaciens]|uniref:holin family protein n=1 Tax=Serratia liquefaciens TaxID=614 RepID=UPI0021CA26D7|nr:holin family protein [Serratia liquefaciens]